LKNLTLRKRYGVILPKKKGLIAGPVTPKVKVLSSGNPREKEYQPRIEESQSFRERTLSVQDKVRPGRELNSPGRELNSPGQWLKCWAEI
jgi:hypothetical protein